jgi:hypothetical protein
VQIEGKSKTLKPKSIFQQAKQMEKEQIMDTGNCVAEVVLTRDESYNGNKYWNEFYGGVQ